MKQLKAVLGTAVDMTVYRKLRLLSYLTAIPTGQVLHAERIGPV